jgi:hypothetical protein
MLPSADIKKEQTSDYYEAFTTTTYPDGTAHISPTGRNCPKG